MNKTNLIVAVVVGLLIVGAIFVSATFQEEQEEKKEVVEKPQPACGTDTCKYECGGNCGMPSCGCS